jgi:hypothetical protein
LPYNRGNQGERWGRGVFQHIQTDAFTTPVHCIDRIAYEGVVTKHSGGDGLEVTHSLVGSQNPASQINELRPSVTVTRTSPSPTSRLGLSVIPTRKAIHQSDVVNRPYDMTESTLSVQNLSSSLCLCLLFCYYSHVVRDYNRQSVPWGGLAVRARSFLDAPLLKNEDHQRRLVLSSQGFLRVGLNFRLGSENL